MSLKSTQEAITKNGKLLLGLVAVLWIIEIIDLVIFRTRLDQLGIQPRSFVGLRGILFAPFLHGGLAHIAANTIPLIVLSGLTLLRGLRHYLEVSVIIMLIGGLGVWLTGANGTVHIGASIVIFGYFGYLLARAWFERSFGALLVAVIVIFLYGSLLLGVLPGQKGISWQGHLFGFIGGIVAARLATDGRRSSPS